MLVLREIGLHDEFGNEPWTYNVVSKNYQGLNKRQLTNSENDCENNRHPKSDGSKEYYDLFIERDAVEKRIDRDPKAH